MKRRRGRRTARDKEVRRQIPDLTAPTRRRSLPCAWLGQELWDRDRSQLFRRADTVVSSASPASRCRNRYPARGYRDAALHVPTTLFSPLRPRAVLRSDRRGAETSRDQLQVNNCEQIPWHFSPEY